MGACHSSAARERRPSVERTQHPCLTSPTTRSIHYRQFPNQQIEQPLSKKLLTQKPSVSNESLFNRKSHINNNKMLFQNATPTTRKQHMRSLETAQMNRFSLNMRVVSPTSVRMKEEKKQAEVTLHM